MTDFGPISAFVILVPDASPSIDSWHAQYIWSAARGMPPHITVLYPFVAVVSLSPAALGELRRLFASACPIP